MTSFRTFIPLEGETKNKRKQKILFVFLDEFEEKYLQCEPIGAGGFGSVYSGFRRGDSFPVGHHMHILVTQ